MIFIRPLIKILLLVVVGWVCFLLTSCEHSISNDKAKDEYAVFDTIFLEQQKDSIQSHANLEDTVYCGNAIKQFNNVKLASSNPKLVVLAYSYALMAQQSYSFDINGNNYSANLLKEFKDLANYSKSKVVKTWSKYFFARYYIDHDNYLKAMPELLSCYNDFKELNDSLGQSAACKRIGNAYVFAYNNYDEAILYYKRGLEVAYLEEEKRVLETNLFICYTSKNNIDSIEYYFNKIKDDNTDFNNIDKCYLYANYHLYRFCNTNFGSKDSVEKYINLLTDLTFKNNRSSEYDFCFQAIASYMIALITKNQLSAAKRMLDVGERLDSRFSSKLKSKVTFYSARYLYYKEVKNYELAVNFLEEYLNISSEINSVENKGKIEQARIVFQNDQERKIEEETQKSKDRIVQKEIEKQKLVRNGFIGGFGVVFIFAGFFLMQRNKIKKGNKELQIAKNRAEKSEQFKQQFLANMSHEIRTPMNAVIGMTNLLINKKLPEDQMAYLMGIKNSSDNLLYIINDILDLSKIEAGKLELEKIDFSIRDVVDQVKQTLNHKAEEKGLELILDISRNVPEVVSGDPVRLNQILINLAGNAIKFTEKGSVVVGCQSVASGQSTVVSIEGKIVVLKFSVVDTGIGIPKDKLLSVFESFKQAHSSDTRKYGGTGLGLSISKQFVELMGGKISIESEEGSGTTFSFVINLPVGSVENIQTLKAATQIDGSILNGLRILLSDDNEYNRIVAHDSLLAIADVSIVEATNGKEVVDLLSKSEFDVILMDVQMPIMDGYEATRYIREKFDSPKNAIPIIALTASVIKSDLDKCRQAGMNDYVPKPFIVSQLVTAIAIATGREIKYEKKTDTKAKHENLNSKDLTDLSYLEKFCEGDKLRMQKYINLFISSAPQVIEKIQTAIDNNDLTEIANQVHSFKTKLIMMGMSETKELAMEIEKECREGTNTNELQQVILIFIKQINEAMYELKESS